MAARSKTVLIVGGASGIGRATANLIMAAGFDVISADCDQKNLNNSEIDSKGRVDGILFPLHLDITDKVSVENGLKWIKDKFGNLDCVVISAAIHSTHPIEYLPDGLIHKVIEVNLTSHIKLVRDTLPFIKDGGKLIGISSIAAGLGVPMSSLYSASKAGLEAFYESLSVEVSYRNIKTILIHPGNVNTGFNETGNEYRPTGNSFVNAGYQRVISGIDSSKGMNPDIVANVIYKAVTSPSPRFCYVVGMNALKAHWAKKLLGRDLALKVMAKYFGFWWRGLRWYSQKPFWYPLPYSTSEIPKHIFQLSINTKRKWIYWTSF